jgi:hypothetical protein
MLAWLLAGLPVLAVAGYVALRGDDVARRLQPYMPPNTILAGHFALDRPAFLVPILIWALLAVPLAYAAREGAVRRAALALVILLMAGDLAAFALAAPWRYRSLLVQEPLMPPSGALNAGDARIFPVSSAFIYPYQDLESIRALRYPDWGALAGVRSITGYDAFVPSRYSRVMGRMQSTGVVESPELWEPRHHGADLLGVRTVLLDPFVAHTPAWDRRIRRYGLRPAGGEPDATWLGNPRALPRAWRLARATSLPAGAVDVHVMRDAAFDPAQEGLLDAPARVPGPLAPGPVTASTPGYNEIRFETAGPGPGLVAVSEGYDAGWHATAADGRALPVYRLDGVILGVEVPAGPQKVVLRYEPPRWRPGLAVTALGLLALALWELADRRRKQPVGVLAAGISKEGPAPPSDPWPHA